MNEREIRSVIVEEARTWLRTPWHHRARVKGAGVDCANILCAVYHAAGLVPEIKLPPYPIDWHLHQNEPTFLHHLLHYARPVADGLPGDIAMFKYGRHAAHGSIVVEWPVVIHAYRDERMVVLTNVSRSPDLAKRFAGFFRVKDFDVR